eukprot:CAMPEP_0194233600 /NCGR_PEP_ID=MMETSP0158-20130606/1530_1 /TAXON_ID=33649 /ORGANISM="Thalassionema nitzschioides, Strain L26-B" /LENGTH=1297 /DNA_ID=CAMNT_0038966541 /DNA_START=65 /DNA_END=3958 /DNA_ORIENTATION=-
MAENENENRNMMDDENTITPMEEANTASGNNQDEISRNVEESPPPRLMISKMVLENFKSYAGVREIGPFHQCFSSIVGPNGSGKSNVIDAMLFVFGKRAKKLRLNKVSELIHKSDNFQDLTYAKVSVHFQDIIDNTSGNEEEEPFHVIPDTGCVVSRIARKDNSSSYQLNGKNVPFKQVASFLGTKGIDLEHNRFLILQGEVELISMMPPKGQKEGDDDGLLEYLEDIIGSNRFVADTEAAWEKVEALTNVRQEHLHRVKAMQSEKDALESAKIEAEALLQKERDTRRKQNILYQVHLLDTKDAQEGISQKLQECRNQLEDERKSFQDLERQQLELNASYKEQQKLHETIHEELVLAKKEFTAYERRDIQLKESIKHAKTKKTQLAKKIKTNSKNVEDFQATHDDAVEKIPQLEEELVDLNEQKDKEDELVEALLEQVKGQTQGLRRELDQIQDQLAPIQQERASFEASLTTAEEEVRLLQDSVTRNQAQFEQAKNELATLDQTQADKRRQLDEAQQGQEELENELTKLKEEDETLSQNEKKLVTRQKVLLAQTEETKAAMKARGGKNPTVQNILKAARPNGPLSKVGIVGRLGDLATIDPRYDVAVSTACGMLDHVVVQTTAGAQQCLVYLRKNGLGRANFIPLDKLSKGAHDRPVETPEGAPRLLDLIQPSHSQLKPALYLGVANTLVAPDLDTATRWAYDYSKRWRVVTLDGQLIETSGTMAGGGKSKRKGGMRLSHRNKKAKDEVQDMEVDDMVGLKDCKALEQETNEVTQELQKCRHRRREIQKRIPLVTKKIKSLSVVQPKLKLEIKSCDTTRFNLQERLPELETACHLSEEETETLAKLQGQVQKRQDEMSACVEAAKELEAKQKDLQTAILEAGGKPLKKQQKKCAEALKACQECQTQINQYKVSVKASLKKLKRAKSEQVKLEAELETHEASFEKFQEEWNVLTSTAKSVKETYEQAKETEEKQRVALGAVLQEKEELAAVLQKTKHVEVEYLGKIETLEKQQADLNKKQKYYESELDKLFQVEEDAEDLSDDEDEEKDTDAPLAKYTPEAIRQYSSETLVQQIATLQEEQALLAKDANMAAIAEYRKKEADYLARISDLDAVTEERQKARQVHDELRRKRLETFLDGFSQITLKLKEMYQMITLGGDAELELVDSLDPFAEGIVFSVRPPKKSWKNISNLSGGEKTLSSLALVFALHHYKPTPLYVMDEIDAALDFKNVSIVANYIKERTKNAQFIIISLRNNMFELADRLVGIYKTENCTKSVTIDPKAFESKQPLQERTNLSQTA